MGDGAGDLVRANAAPARSARPTVSDLNDIVYLSESTIHKGPLACTVSRGRVDRVHKPAVKGAKHVRVRSNLQEQLETGVIDPFQVDGSLGRNRNGGRLDGFESDPSETFLDVSDIDDVEVWCDRVLLGWNIPIVALRTTRPRYLPDQVSI